MADEARAPDPRTPPPPPDPQRGNVRVSGAGKKPPSGTARGARKGKARMKKVG